MNSRSRTPSNGSASSGAPYAGDRSSGELERIRPEDLVKLPGQGPRPFRRGARARQRHRAVPPAVPRIRLAPRDSPASRRALARGRPPSMQPPGQRIRTGITLRRTATAPGVRRVTQYLVVSGSPAARTASPSSSPGRTYRIGWTVEQSAKDRAMELQLVRREHISDAFAGTLVSQPTRSQS